VNAGKFFAELTWRNVYQDRKSGTGKSSLTISAKPVEVASQPSMRMGEQSSLLMLIAATESGSFCEWMKS